MLALRPLTSDSGLEQHGPAHQAVDLARRVAQRVLEVAAGAAAHAAQRRHAGCAGARAGAARPGQPRVHQNRHLVRERHAALLKQGLHLVRCQHAVRLGDARGIGCCGGGVWGGGRHGQVGPRRLQLLVKARHDGDVVHRSGVEAALRREHALDERARDGLRRARGRQERQHERAVRLLRVANPPYTQLGVLKRKSSSA
jgi:hypothetical protein